jgi:hypothetical protein
MSTSRQESEVADGAVSTLEAYLRDALSLDELIAWAEKLEARPVENAWLQRVSTDLANPLLCRELATALVHEHLRARAAEQGTRTRKP